MIKATIEINGARVGSGKGKTFERAVWNAACAWRGGQVHLRNPVLNADGSTTFQVAQHDGGNLYPVVAVVTARQA